MRSALSVITDELCQNAAGRLRVDERDLEAEQPAARLLVDQTDVVGLEPSELGGRDRRPRTRRGACPGPRLARNFPTGVSGPERLRAARSGTSPTRSDAASTPWSSTRSRCSSVAPKSVGVDERSRRRDRRRRSRRDGAVHRTVPLVLQDRVDELALPFALHPLVLDEVRLEAHAELLEHPRRRRCCAPRAGRSRGGSPMPEGPVEQRARGLGRVALALVCRDRRMKPISPSCAPR